MGFKLKEIYFIILNKIQESFLKRIPSVKMTNFCGKPLHSLVIYYGFFWAPILFDIRAIEEKNYRK